MNADILTETKTQTFDKKTFVYANETWSTLNQYEFAPKIKSFNFVRIKILFHC